MVRGICCLKTGIPGVSENITVRSIVGNFLEHSRIYCFNNDGHPEVYLASADWMPRNLDRRVEILFPVDDETLRERVREILDLELEDNVKAHILMPDGRYAKVRREEKSPVNSQKLFCQMAKAAVPKKDDILKGRKFTPMA